MYADPYHTYMRFCYIIPTGKFYLIFYFREEEKNNYPGTQFTDVCYDTMFKVSRFTL